MYVLLGHFYNETCVIHVCSKLPEKEDDSLTSATRLLEKRREMTEVEQALAAQKEVFEFI
jgi:hypothetical protein